MNQEQSQQFLGSERIPRLMLKFSVPCVLSLLISAIYNIVDRIFIGNSELSAPGNAATGVVVPIFIIAQAFAESIAYIKENIERLYKTAPRIHISITRTHPKLILPTTPATAATGKK